MIRRKIEKSPKRVFSGATIPIVESSYRFFDFYTDVQTAFMIKVIRRKVEKSPKRLFSAVLLYSLLNLPTDFYNDLQTEFFSAKKQTNQDTKVCLKLFDYRQL